MRLTINLRFGYYFMTPKLFLIFLLNKMLFYIFFLNFCWNMHKYAKKIDSMCYDS